MHSLEWNFLLIELVIRYLAHKLLEKVMEYLESTMETLWFTGNGYVPITNECCYFNATLTFSVMDENAISNVQN